MLLPFVTVMCREALSPLPLLQTEGIVYASEKEVKFWLCAAGEGSPLFLLTAPLLILVLFIESCLQSYKHNTEAPH